MPKPFNAFKHKQIKNPIEKHLQKREKNFIIEAAKLECEFWTNKIIIIIKPLLLDSTTERVYQVTNYTRELCAQKLIGKLQKPT